MEVIAYIRSPYVEKFGVPRQGKLAQQARCHLVFTESYRQREALRGIEQFSHLWLIWGFHLNGETWHPTVRPPRLGGNERLGVFATRSPFRPNPLGLSAVRLLGVLETPEGPVLELAEVDLVDGTPIYDIKPYIPYADAIAEATGGFAQEEIARLRVKMPPQLPAGVTEAWVACAKETLELDPRPAYHEDEKRLYHLKLKPFELSFRVLDGVVEVVEIVPLG